jgi:hypothetical protein
VLAEGTTASEFTLPDQDGQPVSLSSRRAHGAPPTTDPRPTAKSVRFHRTLLEEFAYERLDEINTARLAALQPWVDSYNFERPHTAVAGLTPSQRCVTNADGNHREATPRAE